MFNMQTSNFAKILYSVKCIKLNLIKRKLFKKFVDFKKSLINNIIVI